MTLWGHKVFFSMRELNKFWGVNPEFVLHVGAHTGEESESYNSLGCQKTTWIEAQPDKVHYLKKTLDSKKNVVIEAAVWSEDGINLNLKVTSNSESSSLLSFGSHSESYPDITVESEIQIVTKTLDSLLSPSELFDFVNLDIQGAELQALRGFTKFLPAVKWIYMEVNEKHLYQDCALINEVDNFLRDYGFQRVATRWWKRDGWGDAIYVSASTSIPRGCKFSIFRAMSQFRWNLINHLRILLNR
jgi:FkbM family methyltransferase